jgi:hypothetical protein
MVAAPMELVVLAFDDFKPTGEIARGIADLVDKGIIRIVDLLFVSKSADGDIAILELDAIDPDVRAAFQEIAEEVDGLIGEEDVDDLADSLPAGSAAGLILFEHTWVRGLREKVLEAGGQVVFADRIPAEAVEAVMTAMEGSE